jgi:predicted deacylase
MGGTDVTMSQFLELLTTALLQINSGNNNTIPLRNISAPLNPIENIHAGYIYKSEYLKIASDVKKYIDDTGKTPDYAYDTSLGTYMGYENLIYMYAMILDYYNSSGKMADWAGMKPWNAVMHPPKIDVIITGTGGDVTNNYVFMQNIPRNQFIDEIISAARNGTPMITFGDGNGPKVMITAGVHGNELPSQIAVMKLINYLYGTPIRGTVYVVPFVAPSSTAQNIRFWNGQNLNSIANVAGTPTNQILNIAKQLQVNALGDFHSTQPGGVPGQNSALCTRYPTYASYLIADYISRNTGSAFIPSDQAGVDYPGALEDVTNLAGIPAVTCEVLSPHGTVAAGSVDMSFGQLLAFLRYHGIL